MFPAGETSQCGACVKTGERKPVLQVGAAAPGHTARQTERRLISGPTRPLGGGEAAPAPDHRASLGWSLSCSGEGYR